ncbi:MAG: DUF5683 domain-containing protein [Crocinitomicaceae bacterium]|nr:DUF5683 domain-containing protein [Crocinitomicaceae bacterium]
MAKGIDTSYTHIRKRAAIWSVCLPGSGQIYNEVGYRKYAGKKHRAWWKVPIIYGGLGATGYFFYNNYSEARGLKQEILYRRDNQGMMLNYTNYSNEDSLINGYTEYDPFTDMVLTFKGFNARARDRDLLIFAFAGVWLLQTIEAYVDAHFVTFDVSDKLTFSWNPRYFNNTETVGLDLRLRF